MMVFESMQHIYEKTKIQFQKGYLTNSQQEHASPISSCKPYDHCCPDLPFQHPNMYKFACLIKQELTWYGCRHCQHKAVINSVDELNRFKKYRGSLVAEKDY
ncbi:MAG: hypothetical protein DRH26_01975 [Deltaproteobacteria bacterium]|nr:MAG: hypothetical protein DRH26_01975 [Deltaproteobacteria bacterium]